MSKFDYFAARDVGYSDEDIAKFLAAEAGFDFDGALAAGYSATDVALFLAEPDTEVPKERTFGDVARDIAVNFGVGGGQVVNLLGSLYGVATGDMENKLSSFGADTAEFWESKLSPEYKAAEKARQDKINAADTEFEKAGVALWETISNPLLLVGEFARQVPNFAVGGLTGVGAKVAAGTGARVAGKELSEKALTTIGVSAGTAGGVGLSAADFAQTAYEQLMELPDEVWLANPEVRARVGDNLDLLPSVKREIATALSQDSAIAGGIITAGLNALPGAKTIEKVLGGKALTGSRLRRGATGLLGETFSEGLEEGATSLTANIAQSQIDPSTALFEGVGQATGQGAAVGGGFGLVAGGLSPSQPPAPGQLGPPLTPGQPLPVESQLAPGQPAETRLQNATNASEAVQAASDMVSADIEALERETGMASDLTPNQTPGLLSQGMQAGPLPQTQLTEATFGEEPVAGPPAPALTLESLIQADTTSMAPEDRAEFIDELTAARTANLPAQREQALQRAAEVYGRAVGPIQYRTPPAAPAAQAPAPAPVVTEGPSLKALSSADTTGMSSEDRADFVAQLNMARGAEPGPVQQAALQRAAEIYGTAIGPIRQRETRGEEETQPKPSLRTPVPRPSRILGRPTSEYSDSRLLALLDAESTPPVTKRGIEIELQARASTEQTAPAGPFAQTGSIIQPMVTGDINAAIQEGQYLSIPGQMPDLADQSVAGQSAGQRARERAQAITDRAYSSRGSSSPVTFGEPSAEAEAGLADVANLISELNGANIVAFSDTRPMAVEGVNIGGYSLVNVGSTEAGAVETAFHEAHHHIEKLAKAETAAGLTDTPAQDYVERLDEIFDDISEEGKRSYIENLLYVEELADLEGDAREAFIQEKLDSPELRSEMVSDFMAKRAVDKQFWKDLAKADPDGFEGFVKRWLAVLDNLLETLRASPKKTESKKVDSYIRDLNKAKLIAQSALIDFRKRTQAQAQLADDGAPVFSRKQGETPSLSRTESDREFRLALEKETRKKGQVASISAAERAAVMADAAKFGLTSKQVADVLAAARDIKTAFPQSDGWAPLTLVGVDMKTDDNGKVVGIEPKFKAIPYAFNKPPGVARAPATMDTALLKKVADQFEKLVNDVYQRAEAGDKNAQIIIAHQAWYRNVTEVLRNEYGGQGDLLADLLGATSPNTPVDTNWRFSIEILNRFMKGEFNAELAKFDKHISNGGRPSQYPSADKIRQVSGKLYGMNSTNAMLAMLDMWRIIEPGTAPKARNFALNLIGQSNMATIDVWAARMLRRAANNVRGMSLPRIPPPAEQGVSGAWNADATKVTNEFGFGAAVMDEVSKRLAAIGRNVTPPDLQAIAWFIEKELWGRKGWTSITGEGGSVEENMRATPAERYLAGWSIQRGEKVPEQGETSIAQARVMGMLVNDDSVITARVMPTYGLYGGVIEQSFDTEWTVKKGQHNPAMVLAEVAKLAKENQQYDIFVSRVLGVDETSPNARPGIEIFFSSQRALQDAMPILEKFTERGQDGFTMAVDPRAKSGSDTYIGVRLQYVPEISARWDSDTRNALLQDGGVERILAEKSALLDQIADEVSKMPGVAFARQVDYDTVVVGKENYDEYIDSAAGKVDSAARSGWFGQPVRQAIERAVARLEGDRREVGSGSVPDAGGEVPTFSRKQKDTPEFKRWFGDSKVVDAEGNPLVVYHGTGGQFNIFSADKRGSFTKAKSAIEGFFFTSSSALASQFRDSAQLANMNLPAVRQALEGLPESQFEEMSDSLGLVEDYYVDGRAFVTEEIIDKLEQDKTAYFDDRSNFARNLREYIDPAVFDTGEIKAVYLSVKNPRLVELDEDSNFNEGLVTREIKAAKREGNDGVIIKGMRDTAAMDDRGDNQIPSDVYVVFEPTQVKSAIGNIGTFDPDNPDIRFSRKQPVTVETSGRGSTAVAKVGSRVVGRAVAWEDSRGEFVIMNTEVRPEYRRRGIATQMYQAIERESGRQLKPAVSLSDDAFEFWKAFRPSAVALDLRHWKDQLIGAEVVSRYGPGKITKASGGSVTVGLDTPTENGGTQAVILRAGLNDALKEAGSPTIDFSETMVYSDEPDIRFSRKQPNRLYSALARAAEGGPTRAPAAQWKGLLRNKAKAEEITWSGIEDWLDTQTGSVSREDVTNYLANNGVQVGEVVLKDNSALVRRVIEQAGYEIEYDEQTESYLFTDPDGDLVDYEDLPPNLQRSMSIYTTAPAKYGEYTLPGGENYREVLLTLPSVDPGFNFEAELRVAKNSLSTMLELVAAFESDGNQARADAYRKKADELKERIAEIKKKERQPISANFQSTHWPGVDNVIAHVRLNDRTDAKGNRVLFVEELQSDWAQTGRDEGFIKGPLADQPMVAKINTSATEPYWEILTDSGVFVANVVDIPVEESRRQDAIDAGRRLAASRRTQRDIPAAPFVGKTDSWLNLALKRVVTMAVEDGYEKVAFTTGQQNVDRYKLSKQLSEIVYDSGTLRAFNSRGRLVIYDVVAPEDLDPYVGKEIADRIRAGIAEQTGPERTVGFNETENAWVIYDANGEPDYTSFGFLRAFATKEGAEAEAKALSESYEPIQLSGLDLEVGGEGMKAFYDKIVPNTINNLLKKTGGGRVETVTLSGGLKQPGFAITDEMIDQVTDSGLPLFSRKQSIFNKPLPSGSLALPDSKLDDVIYTLQDKLIDTKRVIENITKSGAAIADKWDGYLQETLYHGRTAKRTSDFAEKELKPLIAAMSEDGVTIEEFDEYLHNRHAEERNNVIAKRNPALPDAGSGIPTADARAYLSSLPAPKRATLEALAKRVDAINAETRKTLLDAGLESKGMIDAWEKTYSTYVPLMREELDFDFSRGPGTGQGFDVRGGASRRATGSADRRVVDILANVAMQRERAIVRAEKNRVSQAMYGLAIQNPDADLWLPINPDGVKDPKALAAELVNMGINPIDANNIASEPTQQYVDPRTGLVMQRVNPLLRSSANVISARVNGKDRYLILNPQNPRAERMAVALKNLDADQLGRAMSLVAKGTRWFASVNTQYNPIFGVLNIIRDVEGGLLNLSTTELKGEQKKVLADTLPALRGIYSTLRGGAAGQWSSLWEEFQSVGGQTGYRDQFSMSTERATALQKEFDRLTAGTAKKAGTAVLEWLSDYNSAMENAVRLSAYKAALDKGMSKERAASLAKNLTVNFNKKGQIATQAGALYAFFNASVQGSTRLIETLGGPAGRKIFAGGALLGVAQALALAAAGFDEDEPPEFIRERNIVIPVNDGKYLTVPMPLGYNVIPNTSRIMTEWALSGFKRTPERALQMASGFFEMFNPIGNAGLSYQTLSPTLGDPLVALGENRDWTGAPIARENFNSLDPTPGHARAKDTASWFSKEFSRFLNLASGGTEFQPGGFSPTPDQLDFLIGQVTGGIGREALKFEQTLTALSTGEELPPYKIPLVGRFFGDSQGSAAEASRFYDNIRRINMHDNEVKGRREARRPVAEYIAKNPEARLATQASRAYREVSALRKRKREMIAAGASKGAVQAMDERIKLKMKAFNARVSRFE